MQRRELQLPPSAFWLAVTGESRAVRTYLGVLHSLLIAAEVQAAEASGGHANTVSDALSSDPLLAGGIVRLASGYELLGPVPSAGPRNDVRRNAAAQSESVLNPAALNETGPGGAGRRTAARTGEVTVYVRCAHALGRSLAAHARAAHREYTAKQLGLSLRLEVDPDV